MITWAGISSNDVGMVIEHYPRVILPNRKIEVQTIPGRNGDNIIETDSFENYTQEYSAFLDSKYIGGLEMIIPKVSDWLLGHTGYQRLEDSYFPDVYRMAYYTGGANFVSLFNEYGEGTLTFNCAPEKYYKFGDESITLTNEERLYNPSSFRAEPIITLSCSGDGILSINGRELTIDSTHLPTGTTIPWPITLTVDVKTHKAYSGTTNYNMIVAVNYEHMKLDKESVISWSGGITGVSIIPRWWTI